MVIGWTVSSQNSTMEALTPVSQNCDTIRRQVFKEMIKWGWAWDLIQSDRCSCPRRKFEHTSRRCAGNVCPHRKDHRGTQQEGTIYKPRTEASGKSKSAFQAVRKINFWHLSHSLYGSLLGCLKHADTSRVGPKVKVTGRKENVNTQNTHGKMPSREDLTNAASKQGPRLPVNLQSLGESPQEEPTLLTPPFSASSLQNYETTHFCCWSHHVCGTLCPQFQETHTSRFLLFHNNCLLISMAITYMHFIGHDLK